MSMGRTQASCITTVNGFLPCISMRTRINERVKHSISPSAGKCATSSCGRKAVKVSVALSLFRKFTQVGHLQCAR